MDSPSARKPGDFNWGSTLWHEMSHVFILTATNFRVPRWFTEGLAVHEEGERSSEWKNQPTPDVLAAIRDKKLLPVARLDRGFVYPDYPSQVIVSYFQAGSICDFVKAKWGDDKLLDMVHSYAQLKDHAAGHSAGSRTDSGGIRQAVSRMDQSEVWRRGRALRQWREKLKALVAAAKQNDIRRGLAARTSRDCDVSRVCGRCQRLRVDRRCCQEPREMQRPKRRS